MLRCVASWVWGSGLPIHASLRGPLTQRSMDWESLTPTSRGPLGLGFGTPNPRFIAWPLELGLGTLYPCFIAWPLELGLGPTIQLAWPLELGLGTPIHASLGPLGFGVRDSQSTLHCVAP